MNTTVINSEQMESTMSTIAVMCRQEEMAYRTDEGVYYSNWHQIDVTSSTQQVVDMDCRDKMVEWTFQVVDFLKFDRETASISMNYLDRYLMTLTGQSARSNRPLYQLATMTALYMAAKIHEPIAMDPGTVSTLSQGAYSAEQIEQMEKILLSALSWRVNPPTSLAFCRQFLELLLPDLDAATRETVYELCQYQTELATRDGRFLSTKASTIAFCALMNALECVVRSKEQLEYFAHLLSLALNLDLGEEMVGIVSQALYGAVSEAVLAPPLTATATAPSQQQEQQQTTAEKKGSSCFEVSPRAVAHTGCAAGYH